MDIKLAILMGIVSMAYMVGATTGFGSAIIALTLAALIYPIEYVIPVIIPLNILATGYLILRHWSGIEKQTLVKKILPLTCLGMPVGFLIFTVTQAEKMKFAFGLFVICLAVFELIRLIRTNPEAPDKPLSKVGTIFWLFGGGVIQGLWVSGGPMLAYWAGRNIHDKGRFRSTLSSLWFILNIVLFIGHFIAGRINAPSAWTSAVLLPFLALGLAFGEFIHERIPEKKFRLLVSGVLVFTGAAIVIRAI